ncbi:isoprenoid synthase domain-containing protein [Hysterangium stoloniferum]|nr:isoprenoid synthase domain-containing protein [Hysterangium stoloniferum]
MSKTIIVPDLFAIISWPYECKVNPQYHSNAMESKKWMETFQILPPTDLTAFHRFNFPLLASLFYPTISQEHHRLAVDLFHWFYLIDELTDLQSGEAARELTNIILGALRDPSQPLPVGTHALGEMTREVWSRIRNFSVPSSADRLQRDLEVYIEAVFNEANNRETGHIHPSVKEYFLHRRSTAAMKATLDVCMLAADIPESVTSDPRVQRLTEDGIDLTWIHNDIYSYSFERARGVHAHNLVTTVIKEKSISVQEAIDYCGELFRQTAQSFFDNLQNVPSFSADEQQALLLHTDGIGYFLTGMHEWSHKSPRYFGNEGEMVRNSREIELADEPLGRQYDYQLQTSTEAHAVRV